jgi:tRNA G46 methylase TrmB
MVRHEQAGDSRPVRSRQQEVHPRLRDAVMRHASSPWRQPLHAPTASAFRALDALVDTGERRGLVLDSGCGTGASSLTLARRHPHRLVLGVDRSARRLARTLPGPWPCRRDNLVLLRGELTTVWRLLLAEGWSPAQHWLLYPNPWPKPGQYKRRWHAHPVFPDLLALRGRLLLRCNWLPYAGEFELAVRWLTKARPQLRRLHRPEGLSPFERKYAASGHELFEVTAELGTRNAGFPDEFRAAPGSGPPAGRR